MRRILWAVIALYAPWAGAVYKCVDEHGATLFGDTPPAGCGHVPIYEMSASGAVVRRIDPTPTPEELKTRLEEQDRAKKAAAAAAEQKRQDMALLNTYTMLGEFDVARDRNIEPIQGRIQSASERLKELDKNETQLHETGEHYRTGKDGEVPAWVTANLERIATERAGLTKAIVQSEKEIAELRAKYARDKKRWIVLKGGQPPEEASTAAAPAPAPAPRKRLSN